MLIHICCSVDSHYFLERIKEEYPQEELVGYFYDPNIHPYSEYRLRFLDVQYSCKKLGIPLLEGEYNLEEWLKKVKGLENEPEKGDRCTVCFDDRLEKSVQKAKELKHDKFTTTLLISPKKSQDKLFKIGNELSSSSGLEFIFKDYRSGSGTQEQGRVVKEHSLYRQNYCGCLFGLTQQRQSQDKLMDEMFSPISQQILPESIEERLELYAKRDELEESNSSYKIVKKRFLNYRILWGLVKLNKRVIPSYFLPYSTINRGKMSGRVEYIQNGVYYLNRDEVKVVELKKFNELASSSYENLKELIFNPLDFEKELEIRTKIMKSGYDLSTIVIIEKFEDGKFEIELDSKIYEDVKEEII